MGEYTFSDGIGQLTALPLGMLLWIRLLGLVNLSSVFFVRRTQARWVLAALIFIAVVNPAMMAAGSGLVKLLGVPHLFVWIPLIAYLASQFRSGHVNVKSPFGVWCFVVMVIDLISVVFDLRDSAQYVLGDRSVVTGPSDDLPIPTLLVIAVSGAALVAYAVGFSPKERH